MITFLFVALLLLGILFLGLPVAFGLGGTAWLLIILFDLPTELIIQTLYTSMDSFVLLAVPLYVLMSQILLEGKIGDDLFEVMNVWVRHLPGGLAIATILACAFFAAITGSGAAKAATIGLVAYPAMVARGYDKKFTLGLLAAGGTLGILIPPSIPMILYGAVTEESVGKLFMGGVVPGIVMATVFIFYAVIRTLRKGFTPIPPATWKERFGVTRKNLAGIFLFHHPSHHASCGSRSFYVEYRSYLVWDRPHGKSYPGVGNSTGWDGSLRDCGASEGCTHLGGNTGSVPLYPSDDRGAGAGDRFPRVEHLAAFRDEVGNDESEVQDRTIQASSFRGTGDRGFRGSVRCAERAGL